MLLNVVFFDTERMGKNITYVYIHMVFVDILGTIPHKSRIHFNIKKTLDC